MWPPGNAVHIRLELIVGIEAELLLDLLVGLLPHRDLLLLGDQRELVLAGRRVGRAARQHKQGRQPTRDGDPRRIRLQPVHREPPS
jgi:hypothetical protein